MLCCLIRKLEHGIIPREVDINRSTPIDNVYNLGAEPNLRTLEILAHLRIQVLVLISFTFDSDCLYLSYLGEQKVLYLEKLLRLFALGTFVVLVTFDIANKVDIFALGTSVVLANLGIAKFCVKKVCKSCRFFL